MYLCILYDRWHGNAFLAACSFLALPSSLSSPDLRSPPPPRKHAGWFLHATAMVTPITSPIPMLGSPLSYTTHLPKNTQARFSTELSMWQ